MRPVFENGYIQAVLDGNNSEAVGDALVIPYGRVYTYNKATGKCNLAHSDQVDNLFISTSSTKKVGDYVTLYSVKTINRTFMATVTETCARGTALYLDVQTTAAAATGKLKVTIGNATKAIFYVDDTVTVADTGVVPVVSADHFVSGDESVIVGTVGGAVTIAAGAMVTYSAGTVVLAHDEDAKMFVAKTGGAVGETIEIQSYKTLNKEFTVVVTEAVSVGDSLYLDEQADTANATGKVKKTADTATVVIFVATSAATGADEAITVISNNN